MHNVYLYYREKVLCKVGYIFLKASVVVDAIYNKCNICVGGKTNRVETEGVDCNGGCDNSYRQFANLDDGCYPSDMNVQKFIRREFCDGVWNSGAKLDE